MKTAKPTIIATLDIGTTKVCGTLFKRAIKEPQRQPPLPPQKQSLPTIKLLALAKVPAEGLNKGVIVDMEGCSRAIRNCLDKLQAELTAAASSSKLSSSEPLDLRERYQIDKLFWKVGISACKTMCSSVNYKQRLKNRWNLITQPLLDKLLQALAISAQQAVAASPNKKEPWILLHIFPQAYILDNSIRTTTPKGMVANSQIELQATCIYGDATSIYNLQQALNRAGVSAYELILGSVVGGELLLTQEERRLGSLIIDIGGGRSDVAIYKDGAIINTFSLPIGGNHISYDIAYGLKTPIWVAEQLKLQYGNCLPILLRADDFTTLEVPSISGDKSKIYSRNALCDIIYSRLSELFKIARQNIEKSIIKELLPAGAVLTGGCALTPGLIELSNYILGIPTRLYKPIDDKLIQAPPQLLNNPMYSVTFGLALYSYRAHDAEETYRYKPKRKFSIHQCLKSFRNQLKNLIERLFYTSEET